MTIRRRRPLLALIGVVGLTLPRQVVREARLLPTLGAFVD